MSFLNSSCSYSSADDSVVVVDYSGPLLAPAASVLVSNPSDALSIPRPPTTLLLLSLSPWDHLTPPTTPLLSSILWACKHTAASVVGYLYSDALSLLLPLPTPLLSSSSPQSHFLLLVPPPLSPILQACHRDSSAFLIVPKSSLPPSLPLIPRTRCLFLVLRRLFCRCS